MSVPINAHEYRRMRGAPKYKKRANFRARRRGFQGSLHEFMFHQLLAMNIAKQKAEALHGAGNQASDSVVTGDGLGDDQRPSLRDAGTSELSDLVTRVHADITARVGSGAV